MSDLVRDQDVVSLGSRWNEVLDAFEEISIEAADQAEGGLDDVLRLVGRRLCGLLGVSRCSVYLREGDVFRGRVGYHDRKNIDAPIRLLIAGTQKDHFTREIVQSKAPVYVADARSDRRTIRSTMAAWNIGSMLGVPLVSADTTIGIIYLDDPGHRGPRTFDPLEVAVARAFSRLAALTIRHAAVTARSKRHASKAENQRAMLERLDHLHSSLTAAVLSGVDSNEVVRRISGLVDKPVALYSAQFELLTSCNPRDPDGRVPLISFGAAKLPWIARRLRSDTIDRPSMTLEPDPAAGLNCRHCLAPLRVDNEVIGFLAVAEIGQALGPLDQRVAEHGATVLALQRMVEYRAMASQSLAREDLLSDLLDGGRDDMEVSRRAALLNVDLESPHVVVRLVLDAARSGEIDSESRRSLFTEMISGMLSTSKTISTTLPGVDLLYVPLPKSETTEAGLNRVKQVVTRAIDRLRTRIPVVGAAISSPCTGRADIANAHQVLRSMVPFIELFDLKVVLADDLGVFRLVLSGGDGHGAVQFAHRLLRPLIDHDADNDASLVDTLRAFVDNSAQTRSTSQALGVHENTVRYRLTKIAEISTIDPARLESLLDVTFALRIIDLRERLPNSL